MDEQYLKQIIELQKQVIELQKELLLATKQIQQTPVVYPQIPAPVNPYIPAPSYPYAPASPIWVIPPYTTTGDIVITDTGTSEVESSYTCHLAVV